MPLSAIGRSSLRKLAPERLKKSVGLMNDSWALRRHEQFEVVGVPRDRFEHLPNMELEHVALRHGRRREVLFELARVAMSK